ARLLRGEAAAERLAVAGHVVGLDLASREHVVACRELALGVPLEEQHFDGGRRAVTEEDESGGRRRSHGRGHGEVSAIVTQASSGLSRPVQCFELSITR